MIRSSLPNYSQLCERSCARPVAVVFRAEHYNALALIRSLGRRGVPVAACGREAGSIAFYSRYVTEQFVYPGHDLAADRQRFIRRVLEIGRALVRRGLRPVAFPGGAPMIRVFSEHRAELSEFFELFLPSRESVENSLDKLAQYRTAAEIGIPIPLTYADGRERELLEDEASGRVRLPLLLRLRAPEADAARNRRFHRLRIESREALETALREARAYGAPFLVQEFIPGGDEEFYAFGSTMDREGRVVAGFTCHKLRRTPGRTGLCRVDESLDVPPIVEPSVRLLRALRFHGISEIAYKYDRRDGRHKLMKVNPQSWSWIGLPVELGVDLPYAAFCAALDFELPEDPIEPLPRGVWTSLCDEREPAPHRGGISGYEKTVEAYYVGDDPVPSVVYCARAGADLARRRLSLG